MASIHARPSKWVAGPRPLMDGSFYALPATSIHTPAFCQSSIFFLSIHGSIIICIWNECLESGVCVCVDHRNRYIHVYILEEWNGPLVPNSLRSENGREKVHDPSILYRCIELGVE